MSIMKKEITLSVLVLFLLKAFLLSQAANTYQQQKKIALIIGNGNYTGTILANPENDARAMRAVLQSLGFTVFEYENIGQNRMKKVIDDFGMKLKENDVGLFYYAGHGIQSKGYNYLIPVDADLKTEEQVEYDCVRADRILSLMETSGTKVNIIILDACRNNPFERSWTRSAVGRGLAYMGAPKGTLIAYATSPGTTASDGSGKNGLYTSAILESIQIPDITIIKMFQNVRNIVSQKSGNQQIPWESTSLTGDFYFNTTGMVDTSFQVANKTGPANGKRDNGSSGFFTDIRDDHQYKTVKIGSQVWMTENLNYDSGGGSRIYENNSAGALVYGRLYDWMAATLVCPSGWHLPDNEEWSALINYLGGDSIAGGKMKENGVVHWQSPNTGATNEAGFTALPGGILSDDGNFYDIRNIGRWWSSTEESTFNAWSVMTTSNETTASKVLVYKKKGLSVRCIRDN